MAVSATQGVALTSSAGTIVTNGGNRQSGYLLSNLGGTTTIYLGGSAVTTSNGFRWTSSLGNTFNFALDAGETLYGVVTAGTVNLDVLGRGAT
jgi:hypothetical protein